MVSQQLRELLTVKQCTAEVFENRVSSFSVRRWIAKGIGTPKVKLRATRLGRDYFIARQDALEFLDALQDPSLFARRTRDERCEQAIRRLRRAGA